MLEIKDIAVQIIEDAIDYGQNIDDRILEHEIIYYSEAWQIVCDARCSEYLDEAEDVAAEMGFGLEQGIDHLITVLATLIHQRKLRECIDCLIEDAVDDEDEAQQLANEHNQPVLVLDEDGDWVKVVTT